MRARYNMPKTNLCSEIGISSGRDVDYEFWGPIVIYEP
jgi:hypothetical protein